MTVISNTLLASRTLTQLLLEDATMSGGLLKAVNGGTTVISGGTITAGALVETLASGIALCARHRAEFRRHAAGERDRRLCPHRERRRRKRWPRRGWQRPHLRPLRRHRQYLLRAHRQRRVAYRRRRGQSTVFTGAVSGFGGVNHSNTSSSSISSMSISLRARSRSATRPRGSATQAERCSCPPGALRWRRSIS